MPCGAKPPPCEKIPERAGDYALYHACVNSATSLAFRRGNTEKRPPRFCAGRAALRLRQVLGIGHQVEFFLPGADLIYYAGDITPGATALEEVHDEVESLTLQNKISQTYADQVSAWKEELHLVTYPEHLA